MSTLIRRNGSTILQNRSCGDQTLVWYSLLIAVFVLLFFPVVTVIAQDQPTDRTPPSNRPVVEARPSRAAARSKGDITFDDLKFEIEKGGKFDRSMLTKEIKALDKQTVKLRGWILPNSVYKSSGIENFVLVRDNMECCFGPGAAIYDCVIVYMEKGKTTDFTTKPIAVRGKFEIEEYKFPNGSLAAIYKFTASEAK